MRAGIFLTGFVFGGLSAAQAAPVVTQLYSFGNVPDGKYPNGLTVLNGTLYGTTIQGGSTGFQGTVFSVDPVTGAVSVLYSFEEGDGGDPMGPLLALDNVLYGTSDGKAKLFSFDPATGTETVLHAFAKNSFLGSPLLYKSGELTSVVQQGGRYGYGTIFGYNLQNGKTVTRYNFPDGSDGFYPQAILRYQHTLYGTTLAGGTADSGTVFAFDPVSHSKRVLHSFTGSQGDGAYPFGSLLLFRGRIYGTTQLGGAGQIGTIFSLEPSTGTVSTVFSFGAAGGQSDGAYPLAGLILFGGKLWSTTSGGGSSGQGTVFRFDPITGYESVVYSFGTSAADGRLPHTPLTVFNGVLFGTTRYGGTADNGTVFKVQP